MSPNAPRTPHRTFRISDDLYAAVQAKAQAEGISVSDVLRRLFEQWIQGDVSV